MVKFVIYAGALLAACILSEEESVGDTISAKFGNTVSGAAQANVYFEGNGKSYQLNPDDEALANSGVVS